MRFLILFLILLTGYSSTPQIQIIPQPAEMRISGAIERFEINKNTKIVLAHGVNLEKFSNYLNDYLKQYYSLKLPVEQISANTTSSNIIMLSFNPLPTDKDKKGSYNLDVTKDQISISSSYGDGLFYGIQTLIQLLPVPDPGQVVTGSGIQIPAVISIYDEPRFAYRGMHLDVCRHFFPISFIKKYIDYLAFHKINTFHWHLTEDQGWRIEIKKYPKLTSVGGWRNGTIIGRYPGSGNDNIKYGGFYSQAEIKEIVRYAQDRFINVIPEIELPGHSSAAIAAYPELSCFPKKPTLIPVNMISKKSKSEQAKGKIKLVQETWGVFDDVYCAGKENTFKFLQDVMDEVLPLFPSKYIHVGGDECPKTHWKKCPHCQKRMKDNNLKDEHELQSYFIQRIEKYLNSKGRTLIGWDEILEGGLAPNAVVMSWRGVQGGIDAAKQNHDVIMTPGNPVYFDHTQTRNEDSVTIGGYNPIENVYAYEPVPKELNNDQAKHVLGAQANVWTEYMKNTNKVEYMIFPRMAALSEVLWSPKKNRNWEDFEKRLPAQFKRYDLWKANYSTAYYDLKASVLPAEELSGVLWKLESKNKDARIYFNKKQTIDDPPNPATENQYSVPLHIDKTSEYRAWTDGKEINAITQKFDFNKATGKKILLKEKASENYPGDGAFTLVNGVTNERGLARSREFLGFRGTNCEAVIDLGSPQQVSFVVVNALRQEGSWIYQPKRAEVFGSSDGEKYYSLKFIESFNETKNGKGTMIMAFKSSFARFIKVVVTNFGIIPEGKPGAGNPTWLFVDEIEVDGPE